MRRLRGLGWQILGLALLVAASGARAADQGSLGATSSGSIGITLSMAPRAQIEGLDDVRFGPLEGQSRATQGLCLSSNSLARSYTVAAVGSGRGGAFELVNGSDSIGYTVEWLSRDPSPAGPLTLGDSSRAELAAAVTPADCALGAGAADLAIALDPARAQAVRSGTPYTGTLTLLVAPQ